MNKLMTAGVFLALVLSLYSALTASKSRLENEKWLNRTAVAVANVDRLLDVVENVQTNQFKLATGWRDTLNELNDQLGKEIKERRALDRVVEQNAKELIRISGNLERDGDKMYTNIVMFGASVFDLRNEVAVACARIQELEESKGRVSAVGKPLVPGVLPLVPTDAAPEGAPPEWDNPVKKREKERIELENAGSK